MEIDFPASTNIISKKNDEISDFDEKILSTF